MLELPELNLTQTVQWIRIPAELDVPVTPRVKAILDSAAMRRLTKISQLGLVSLVYPGATHSRMEHSLGVYRLAVQVLSQFTRSTQRDVGISEQDAKVFLISALVHDIGHWPYCHPLEDMQLAWMPRHEQLARQLLCNAELARIIRELWHVEPESVADFLAPPQQVGPKQTGPTFLRSLLSGPIDVDKMDYLQRDSLHAGVPYGRNFDVLRLIASLCVGPRGEKVAITEKGKTAAEMMVFARYVMFSEVYWHHAVRSATAMLQRLVFELARSGVGSEVDHDFRPEKWLEMSEAEFSQDLLGRTKNNESLRSIAQGLFGAERRLYKRLAQFNFPENSVVHAAFARKPYTELVACAEKLAERLSRYSERVIAATDILIDAPPVKLEVQFNLDVKQRSASDRAGTQSQFSPLGQLSPVVSALATNQFDNFVKRVRVFVTSEVREAIGISNVQLIDEMLEVAAEMQ